MNGSPVHSISTTNSKCHRDEIMMKDKIASLIFIIMIVTSLAGCGAPVEKAQPTRSLPEGWVEKVSGIAWVAYSPSSANPNTGPQATPDEILADLDVLRDAGFNGLVTYGSAGNMGSELPVLAQEAGFEGLIMGIWDPNSEEEYDAAVHAAQNDIVLGYCIGNEGFNRPSRYDMTILSSSVQKLREATGKPVTTTEEIDDYFYNEKLLQFGDWIFPNAHPYFH